MVGGGGSVVVMVSLAAGVVVVVVVVVGVDDEAAWERMALIFSETNSVTEVRISMPVLARQSVSIPGAFRPCQLDCGVYMYLG